MATQTPEQITGGPVDPEREAQLAQAARHIKELEVSSRVAANPAAHTWEYQYPQVSPAKPSSGASVEPQTW